MRQMKVTLLILLIIVFAYDAEATNYYLSVKGNDNNNGTSKTTPWHSLKRLYQNNEILLPGDSILLESGSIFPGSIKLSCSDIYIGAYHSGPKPIITGAQSLSSWKYFKNNIWISTCEACTTVPGNVYINGKSQPLGRFPDVGYRTIAGSLQQISSLTDSTLKFNDNYWNHAEVVVRSSRWTLDRLTVDHFTENTFHFTRDASYSLENGFGYFIQNHISTLNKNGEWYFDPMTKSVYLYLSNGKHPDNFLVEVALVDFGLTGANVKNILIENIVIQCYRIAGVNFQNGFNVKLEGLDVLTAGRNGMEIIGCENIRVNNCSISESNNNGVQWSDNISGEFTHNSICQTGLQPGRGESGNGTYIGIFITADQPVKANYLFQFNTIDSTGYSAIDFRTGNTQIQNNIISNFCMIKDDGAGIYTWKNTQKGNLIEGNIIYNGTGSGSGTTSPLQLYASGVYIDDLSSHILIKSNRIFSCATSGIFLHNATSITLTDNVVFANGYNIANPEKGQLYIRIDTLGRFGKNKSLKLKVINNQWIAENDATHCIYLSVEKEKDIKDLGAFQENKFQANHNHQAMAVLVRTYGACMTAEEFSLPDWHDSLSYEKDSFFKSALAQKHFKKVDKQDLILNGNMTKDINGWMVWPEKSSIQQEIKTILDGPSLKINVPAGSTEALVYHEGFSLTKGKLYRLSFSAISANPNQVEFVPLMATSPWSTLAGYACFSTGNKKKNFTHFFIPSKSSSNARVNFKSHSGFWIDNVSLNEVE
jgi:parallel beta-helix repeat protein